MSLIDSLTFFARHPLTRDAQISGMIRFLKWQISSRLAPGAIVHDWINGSRFLVRRGDAGLTGNVYAGLHEFREMGYLLHVLREDDLFVDVGANVGSYTILACAAVGCCGVAVEPIPATYSRLVENVRLNRLEAKVSCLNLAVGKEAGRITFTSDLDTANHAVTAPAAGMSTVEVEVGTLDAVLGGRSPTMLKIDVEGFETAVLEGAHGTLSDPALHSVIMELNGSGRRYGYDESAIVETMRSLGFESLDYDPYTRKLRPGVRSDSDNVIFVRDLPRVHERLATSRRVRVLGKEF